MKRACALRYDEGGGDRAPVVLASAGGELADRIEQAARAYGVPVVRDRPLAEALAELREGDEIRRRSTTQSPRFCGRWPRSR